MAVIELQHVTKQFRARRGVRALIGKGGLQDWLKGRRADKFTALEDIDFNIEAGESLGIIGSNGSGKSTLLKIIAGVTTPTSGTVNVYGRVASLLELGAGFHPMLTGRENVFLSGAILGMTRPEVLRKLDAIVAFAGIERFLDMPVKRYSSGMYARLGFSIAAHVNPRVLLVDEVLAVGDAVFRLRCLERMRALVQAGTTLVFVTHNLDQMQSICGRTVVLERGRTVFEGAPREAVRRYMTAMSRAYTPLPTDIGAQRSAEQTTAELESLTFRNDADEEVAWLRAHDTLRAQLALRLRRPVPRLVVELNLQTSLNENLLSFNSARDGMSLDGQAGVNVVSLTIDALPLSAGQYFWNVRLWDSQTGETLLDSPLGFPIVIDDDGRATGLLALPHTWNFASPPIVAEVCASPASRADVGDRREDLLLR